MSTVLSFIEEFVARAKGDDAKALAIKVQRQAVSALKSQIPSLEGDTITFEDKVATAKENLKSARFNSQVEITDRNAYVKNLLDARDAVVKAEEALEVHGEKISFLKEQLELVQTA